MTSFIKTSILILCMLSQALWAQESADNTYGKSKLTLAPLTAYGSAPYVAVGVGLGYERFLNSYVALQADFTYGLQQEMIQLMLGPKFYMHEHDKPVSYGLAPMFLVSKANVVRKNGYNFPFYPTSTELISEYYQFGFMLVNSLNMTLNEKVYLGVEAGLGLNYINRYRSVLVDGLSPNKPSGNRMFRISMGYRF